MNPVAAALIDVRRAIALAAARSGRNPVDVTIVAVTKTATIAQVRQALEAGLLDLGENRVQNLLARQEALPAGAGGGTPDPGDPRWHFIGRLQTNKVRQLLAASPFLIHSLDRTALAEVLDAEARRLGVRVPALVQVNVAGEASKAGLAPVDLLPFLRWAAGLPGLAIAGLMTIAPESDAAESCRPWFRHLAELSREASAAGISGVRMEHLSMGMTGDYPVAVEEGATIVRVGRGLFKEVSGTGNR